MDNKQNDVHHHPVKRALEAICPMRFYTIFKIENSAL